MNELKTKRPQLLISQLLLEDEDLRDIVEEFVDGLETRLAEIRQAYDQMDWDAMSRLAHQLKGAGGSYGYPDISQVAASMEQGFRVQDASNFDDWFNDLTELTTAARQGLQSA